MENCFAGRYQPPLFPDGPRCVIAARVLKTRIIALFNERSEAEVIVPPRYVYGREVRPAELETVEQTRERIIR